MQYMGGKSRIAKRIALQIDRVRRRGQMVWDPFCGGLSMSVALSLNGPVRSSDKNRALIALYNAVRAGWEPPIRVTREDYRLARELPDEDPRKAFAGIACSWGGRWFGGYVPPVRTHIVSRGPERGAVKTMRCHEAGARIIKRDVTAVRGPIETVDFLEVEPRPTDALIYCDPVYRGVTGYPEIGVFDHDLFVHRVMHWSHHTDVFVSEYAFPIGGEIWAHSLRVGMDGKKSGTGIVATERLYFVPRGSIRKAARKRDKTPLNPRGEIAI